MGVVVEVFGLYGIFLWIYLIWNINIFFLDYNKSVLK